MFIAQWELLTIHEVDGLRKDTFLLPGVHCSVAPTRWQQFKEDVAWM